MLNVSICDDSISTVCKGCVYANYTLSSGLFTATGLFFGAITVVLCATSSCTSSGPSTSVNSVPLEEGAMGEGSVTSLPGEVMALGDGGTRRLWSAELL